MRLSTLGAVAALVASASVSAQVTGGSFDTSGSGCPALSGGAFYEQFSGTGTGDLAGTGLVFTAVAGGWNVAPGGSFDTNFGAGGNLATGDDSVVQQALPFAFAVPGFGVLNTLSLDTNGRIGQFTSSDFSESVSEFLNDTDLNMALWWDDLSPQNAPGGMYVDTDLGNPPGQNRVIVTFDQTAQFANSDSNTFQAQLFDNGDMIWYWNAGCADDALVGISTGFGVADPGGIDISTAGAFAFTGLSSPYVLTQSQTPGSGAPNIGDATFSIDIAGIDPAATVGAMNLGFLTANIDLGVIGAPGCTVYTSGDVSFPLATSMPVASFPIPIPNDPALVGGTLYTQAVTAVPGVNALGATTSNQGDINIGTIGEVVFECVGSNTFNSDVSNGYFRLTNNGSADIVSLRIDFNTTGLEFDTDQGGMADRFDGGDGTSGTAGCNNTYRNGSDAVTGLVYAGTAASPCSGDALGWTGVTAGTPTNDWIVIDFAFTDFQGGEVFEFDADTDGGPGTGGDDMANTTITVTLSDGRVLTGTVAAAGADYGRADLN